ncbi:WAS/WASL-interacting protein family member 2 isoform X2 [Mauremys reevesii]|uniref:WAS/WASL-interacting protein family member 2 isoform X2 n=1 Tax=Mauremys reevesii TaxID=260615 RepID=UPI00193F9BE8|nr:WAS/WASL-interacting protein family member 2 isoform X2 [Mauremys reevesii]
MPIPPPPPPPPGPPPLPSFHQANSELPKLSREEQRGRGALLQDICKGPRLKKVTQVNDRSAPVLEKPKGGGGGGSGSSSAALQPKGGLFQGGPPKLRPVGAKDNSDSSSGKQSLQVPGSRSAAPRPPVPVTNSRPHDDSDNNRASPPELPRMQRPSLPDLSRPNSASSTGMKHSSSAPPPPPPGRRANAPPAPPPMHGSKAPSYNREKPLPPTPGQRLPTSRDGPPAPPPIKPPTSPVNVRTGPSSQNQSLAPPPPPYRQPPGVHNGPSSPTNELAPELPQRHNSLHRKTPGPVRGMAPPPPSSASPSLQSNRPPPPARDPPSRGAAPPPPLMRNGGRDAPPPPPPYRMHGSSEPLSRGKPPPPPTRTPAGPPPPPPPVRNGHRDSIATVRSFLDDFESKYSFHPVEDFPAPEEYKHFQRTYPSKTNRAPLKGSSFLSLSHGSRSSARKSSSIQRPVV